jgi:AcrR family transcriptional regulator
VGCVTDDDQQSLRRRMSSSTDPRAMRTRARLIDAFDHLATGSRMPTVAELIAAAHVNRTTFYAHFSEVDELAVAALGELFDVVGSLDAADRKAGRSAAASRDSIDELVQFMGGRDRVYAELLGRGPFYRAVEDAFVERNRHTIAGIPDLPADVDVEVASVYVAAGVLGAIGAWLRADEPVDAAVVVTRITALLPTWLAADRA